MSKEITMKCPECGAIVSGKSGFFRSEFTCSNCGNKINPGRDSMEAVTCSGCGNTVMFDTKIGGEKKCPVCGLSLEDHAVKEVAVSCPSCHLKMYVKYTEKQHTCPVCDTVFDVTRQVGIENVSENGTATVITVPANNQNIIYKHPMTTFPFASQVVVPEGYTALILRDGVCLTPSKPGRYLLSDTIRSMTEQLEYAMLDQTAQISVQIIFVRKLMNQEFPWRAPDKGFTVADRDGKLTGKLFVFGFASVDIINAKDFAEFVGYDNATQEQLIVTDYQNQSRLYKALNNICFNAVHNVLMSAVFQNGIAYGALDAQKLYFTELARTQADTKLAEIGLKTSLFNIDSITFEEDDDLIRERENVEKETEILEESKEAVRRYTEEPFNWESPEFQIHMKDDLALFATVSYFGSIKLRIADEGKFFRNSSVAHWVKEGTTGKAVSEYFARLVKDNSANVIGDILQNMINQTGADIRDLATYYESIRGYIRQELSGYFERDGLSVDVFNYQEKSRVNSAALDAGSQFEEYRKVQETAQSKYAFDQKQEAGRAWIDAEKQVEIDNAQVQKDSDLTRNYEKKAGNTMARMRVDADVENAREEITRAGYLKHKAWDRGDAESELSWKHEMTMRGYQYEGDIARQKHDDKMRDIHDDTQEKESLHYLNQQEIRSRAEELHAKWEADRQMEQERLSHNLEQDRQKWNAEMDRTRERAGLKHDVEQKDAENERIINSILRKIAESDLELQEKRNAYARLLRNQEADDRLRYFLQDADAGIEVSYKDSHMKNLLNQEEKDYMQKLLDRTADRDERIKNADFLREMEVKEKETAHQMELLKMQYEWDKYKAQMAHELDQAAIENERLQKTLDYYIDMGKQDVEKAEIGAMMHEADRKSELGERNFENDRYEKELDYYTTLSEHDVQKTAINAFADRDIRTAEAKFQSEAEAARREREERQEQERLSREDVYMKRADELLSQILSIQSSMETFSKVNENQSIRSGAEVRKAEAQGRNENMRDLIREMEKMIREIRGAGDKIRKGQQAMTAARGQDRYGYGKFRNGEGYGYDGSQGDGYYGTSRTGYGYGNPGYGTSWRNGGYDAPSGRYGNGYGRDYMPQPGMRSCPNCHREIRESDTVCPYCRAMV